MSDRYMCSNCDTEYDTIEEVAECCACENCAELSEKLAAATTCADGLKVALAEANSTERIEAALALAQKAIAVELKNRELQEQIDAATWQPIERAPVDGTLIDVWCSGKAFCDSGRFTSVSWSKLHKKWTKGGNGHGSDYLIGVTHWMPLPKPPEDKP